ncbi:MAG: hypothetical protein RI519_03605 [Balneolaceae bacterium]|nr:hypothetical protein [Balneolaceae bacterium]
MIKKRSSWVACVAFVLWIGVAGQANAQFQDPIFRKVEAVDAQAFEKRFADTKWTGQGLYQTATIDRIPTIELRARLQAQFGDPTVTLGDLWGTPTYRPGKAIQFEYWFIIDGEIPMMILDLDGPFENGLVYVGASRFVDRNPEIKRTLDKLLMKEVKQLGEYQDVFFSPEREQWYFVSYQNGEFARDTTDQPEQF